MKSDPVDLVWTFLRSLPGVPVGAPTGDLVGRSVGDTTIYLHHSGGTRMVRDRMDRADVEFDVYHQDRHQAAALAYLCREALLEALPGSVIGDVQVLDVDEISAPRYFPDTASREHVYGGEVAVFYVDA
jgi:hypothetical protein